MTLFSRKDIGFGRAAAFLLITQIGVMANQTVEIEIVCLSAKVIRNGMMAIVIIPVLSNLCVKSMLEINRIFCLSLSMLRNMLMNKNYFTLHSISNF